MGIPVLHAKTRIPEQRENYLSRPMLIDQLDVGIKKKLTLVIAGAGYGKSSLLVEWASGLVRNGHPVVWYSLDEIDRDPAVFLVTLVAGFRQTWPGFGHVLEEVLNRPTPLDPEHVAITLLSELEGLSQTGSLLIVLDDYHRLGIAPDIDKIVITLLSHLPGSTHIAIASRRPVSFSTARLQACGQINLIAERELRFQREESRKLFEDLDVDPNLVSRLIQLSEGWIAGLQLFRQALTYSCSFDLESVVGDSTDLFSGVYAFVAEEIFERLPEALQEFLLQTSILGTFGPEDCDVIFERNDSKLWLEYLESEGLFILRLQRTPDIYRYHHLLTDYLLQKLQRQQEPTQIRLWHQKAAMRFQSSQRWDEAFEHAFLSENENLIVEIITGATPQMRFHGRFTTIQNWLGRLPPAILNKHPILYYLLAHVWEDRGQHDLAIGAFQQAIKIAEELNDQRVLALAWGGLGSVRQRIGDKDGAQQVIEKVLKYIDGGSPRDLYIAYNNLGLIYSSNGRNREAVEVMRKCLELAPLLGSAVQAQVLNNLSSHLISMGEFREALHLCQAALKIRREINQTPGIITCLSNIGFIQTRLGDLESARVALDEAMALEGETLHPSVRASLISNRADVAALEGEVTQAQELYQCSLELKSSLRDIPGLVHTWTRMSDLWLRLGDPAEASFFAHQAFEFGSDKVGDNELLPAQISLAMAELAQGRSELVTEQIEKVIEKHRQITGNHYELARCLWFLAHARFSLGQDGYEPLAEALALAEQWNYHFLVLTLARDHPYLLGQAVAAGIQPSLVGHILKEIGELAVGALSGPLQHPDAIIRLRAVESLGNLATDEVWKPLAAALDDPDPGVKQAARIAIDRIRAAPPAPLHITTLGRFRLRIGKRVIQDGDWESRKAQTLFKILLSYRGLPVPREQLAEILWPEKDPKSVSHNLNQAVHSLRKVLEPSLLSRFPSRYLFSEGEIYRLELPPGSWVDDLAFEETIWQAKEAQRLGDINRAMTQFQEAVKLYEGDYQVEETYQDWFLARQEHLRQDLVDALQYLAQGHLESGAPEQAEEMASRLLTFDPQHEPGYLLLMRAQRALGKLKAALRTYQRYQKKVCTELGFPLAPEIRQLSQEIRRDLRKLA